MDSSGVNGLKIVPLVCAACSAKMNATPEQAVYQCGVCGISFEMRGGRLVQRPVSHLAGVGSIRLPFWRSFFNLESSSGSVADIKTFMVWCGSVKSAGDFESKPPLLYVPASTMTPPQAVRLGKNIAVRFHEFGVDAGKNYQYEASVLSEKDIVPLAELILLSAMVDARRSDPDFLRSFRLTFTPPELVTIPFEQNGSRLYQPELNLEIS